MRLFISALFIVSYSVFIGLNQNVMAQEMEISGIVTDVETNGPLPGANVVIIGTNIGTTTNLEGRYSISVPQSADSLLFSFLGYARQVVAIDNRTTINVTLSPTEQMLEEAVVVGYTAQTEASISGSVEVVDVEFVKNSTTGNPMRNLQGAVPGLFIQKSGSPTGTTNEILIRGINTLGDNSPLYIIDGVPTKRKEVFENLNPSSIESIQVLKDAASASVYGARASNGVIVVTTEQGQSGILDVKVNYNQSFETDVQRRISVLDAEGRGITAWRASVNDRTNPEDGFGEIYEFDWNGDFDNPVLNSVTPKPFVGGDPNVPAGDTDWQKETFETASVTNLDFTVSGGSENSSVLLNFGYLKNTGMLRNTDFERFNGRLKGDTKIFDDRVRIGMNVGAGTSDELLISEDIGGAETPFLAITLAPTIPVRTKDGEFAGPVGAGFSDRNNPVGTQFRNRFDNTDRSFVNGTGYFEVDLLSNLKFRSSFGLDFSTMKDKNIQQRFQEGFLARTLNTLDITNENFSSLTLTNTLNYDLDYKNHSFNLLAGFERITDDTEIEINTGQDFAVQKESFFVLNAASGATFSRGFATESKLQSIFTKLDYSFNDKYLLAFTFRRDGSSRFGDENEYGIFPSLSGAWRIDQENFMQKVNAVSNLKIKLGVSRVGNQEIGNFAALALFEPRFGPTASDIGVPGFFEQFENVGTAFDINGNDSGALPSGFVQTQAANPELKWETTEELNIGLELGMFDQRFTANFDYFLRETDDILIRPSRAAAVGEGQERFINGATIESNGWELTLGYNDRINDDLNFSVISTFTHFDDEVTKLPESVRAEFPGNAEQDILGQSPRDIFGHVADGIFQNQEEVDTHADQPGKGVGRIRFKDLNGDGLVDDLDQTFIGSGLPSLEYGIRLNVGYKNWDLAVFGSGVAGRKGFSQENFFQGLFRSRENGGTNLLNAWTPNNRDANIPALTLADNNDESRPSTFFLISTDYFKLRNLEIGYTFQNNFVDSFSDNLRIYFRAEEFWTLTSDDFLGPDPERGGFGDIPLPSSFTLGINLDL